jgi:hypothetical protein
MILIVFCQGLQMPSSLPGRCSIFKRTGITYYLDGAHTKESIQVRFLITFVSLNLGICIASTQPFQAAPGAKSRVCYPTHPGNTTDMTGKHHGRSGTATSRNQQQNENEKLIHCHRWGLNLRPSRTSPPL